MVSPAMDPASDPDSRNIKKITSATIVGNEDSSAEYFRSTFSPIFITQKVVRSATAIFSINI